MRTSYKYGPTEIARGWRPTATDRDRPTTKTVFSPRSPRSVLPAGRSRRSQCSAVRPRINPVGDQASRHSTPSPLFPLSSFLFPPGCSSLNRFTVFFPLECYFFLPYTLSLSLLLSAPPRLRNTHKDLRQNYTCGLFCQYSSWRLLPKYVVFLSDNV